MLALGVIGLYFGLGLARDPYAAVVYLRNAVTPFLVFQLTLVIAADGPGDRLRFLRAPVYLLLAYGLAEFLARDALFDLIQANSYMTFSLADIARSGEWIETMRKTGRVLRDLQDTQIVSFLNTDLFGFSAIRMYRMLGPNFHAISFGYGLLLAAFLLLRWRQPVLFCLAVGLLVLVGAKGALICLALCCAALLLDRVRPAATLPVFLAVLGLYASAVIVTGRASGDYHVLGLFGGCTPSWARPGERASGPAATSRATPPGSTGRRRRRSGAPTGRWRAHSACCSTKSGPECSCSAPCRSAPPSRPGACHGPYRVATGCGPSGSSPSARSR
ncbi:hypothetical protein [Methylobacterium gregans]|uniref:hypothetical protein n=1 Tax=Methylobacterium gregans TaxID=374424 RepID=UPI003609CEFE